MRKRHAIIHIGTGKTGSTSIQEMLASSRETLPPIGFAYLLSPGRRTQIQLAAVATNSDGAENPKRLGKTTGNKSAAVDRFRAALSAEIAALPDSVHTVIFSSEHLTNKVAGTEEALRLKALLDEHFESYRIVAYLRRQDEYLASLYSTRLRAGSRRPDVLPQGSPKQLGRLDWNAVLGRWAAVFGRAAVTPRLFARDAFVKGDLIEDFRTLCGLEALALPKPPDLLNPSLNSVAQEFMRRINMAAGGGDPEADEAEDDDDGIDDQLRHSIRVALGHKFAGPGRRPSRAEAEALMAQFEASNEALRAEYFPDRARLFSADFSKYPEIADPLPDSEAVLQVSLAMLLALHAGKDRKADGKGKDKVRAKGGSQPALNGAAGDAATAPAVTGQAGAARQNPQRVLEADPGNAGALRRLVQAAVDPASQATAREHLRRALAAEPDRRDLTRLQRRLLEVPLAAAGTAGDAPTATAPMLTADERAARRARRADRERRATA